MKRRGFFKGLLGIVVAAPVIEEIIVAEVIPVEKVVEIPFKFNGVSFPTTECTGPMPRLYFHRCSFPTFYCYGSGADIKGWTVMHGGAEIKSN